MTGFFGKVPFKGDFISRNLDSRETEKLHQFFTSGLSAARTELQGEWTNRYSVAPIWYFYLAPEILTSKAYLGVWMSSVDSVNRHFPFIVLEELALPIDTLSDLNCYTEWLESVEHLMLDTLEPDIELEQTLNTLTQVAVRENKVPCALREFLVEPVMHDEPSVSSFENQVLQKLEGLENRLARIENLLYSTEPQSGEPSTVVKTQPQQFLQTHLNLLETIEDVENLSLESIAEHTVWFTKGSTDISPTIVIHQGLPEAADFIQFIIGSANE